MKNTAVYKAIQWKHTTDEVLQFLMFILIVKSIIELDYHGYKQNCGTNSGLIQCSDIIKDNTKNWNQIIRGTITQTDTFWRSITTAFKPTSHLYTNKAQ